MTTKAIAYARYSPRPGEPEDILSNAKQFARIVEYAESKGYEIVGQESDEALTGLDDAQDPDPVKSTINRPGLLRAIGRIKKGMVLLVRWRNRLARDPYVQGWVRRTINKQGGRIESADECNEQGLAGELLENTLATVDKYKAIQTAIDTGIAMRRHQNIDHRRMSRIDRCPWGWKPDLEGPTNGRGNPGQLMADPDEQKTLKIILAMTAEGKTPRDICKELDSMGTSRRGKKWKNAHSTIVAILKRSYGNIVTMLISFSVL